jgi:hypothetical protein
MDNGPAPRSLLSEAEPKARRKTENFLGERSSAEALTKANTAGRSSNSNWSLEAEWLIDQLAAISKIAQHTQHTQISTAPLM